VTAKLVARVPVLRDRIDVQRVLEKVEAVQDAVRDDQPSRGLGTQLDQTCEPFRRRAAAQVAQPDDGPAKRHGQVVVVPDVDVHAAQHAGFRPDRVPLDRRDPGCPFGPEELRERPALVDVGLERDDGHSSGQLHPQRFIPWGRLRSTASANSRNPAHQLTGSKVITSRSPIKSQINQTKNQSRVTLTPPLSLPPIILSDF
jgi:hypothetical protein